jgi:hypothetical protein
MPHYSYYKPILRLLFMSEELSDEHGTLELELLPAEIKAEVPTLRCFVELVYEENNDVLPSKAISFKDHKRVPGERRWENYYILNEGLEKGFYTFRFTFFRDGANAFSRPFKIK